GVSAYSTLGFFADPILNTMLRWDDDELATTIFHELAHQRVYVKGDTEFNESFATFVQREGLRALYASNLPPESMRARKAEEIARLRADYARLRDTQWHGDASFDAWINGEINNAKLLPFGLYHRWVAAFAALYTKCGGDWTAFYDTVAQLAHVDASRRTAALEK